MTREFVVEQLRRYQSVFAEEASVVQMFSGFIEENEGCFERGLAVGHITGSAWVVDGTGERVLLTHHRKLDKWLQLGGHADGCADVLSVAKREVLEESGLDGIVPITTEIFDIDVHVIPARKSEPEHLHYDIRYLFRAGSDEKYVVSNESHDLGWVPLEELGRYTDEPSMHRMAAKWAAWRGR
ncbi:NUDIX hydrolase [soil metagenome]